MLLVNLHRFWYFPTGHTLSKSLKHHEENIDAKVLVRPVGIVVIIEKYKIHAYFHLYSTNIKDQGFKAPRPVQCGAFNPYLEVSLLYFT